MKKVVIVSGLVASIIIVGITWLMLILAGDESSHQHSEWLGYLVMILGLSMILVGIKHYRDQHLGGVINFTKGLQIGVLITLVATVFYVTAWEAYMLSAESDFMEGYKKTYIENLQNSDQSPAVIEEKITAIEDLAEKYKNPIFRIGITALEIFPVGLAISILSALLLRNRKILPRQ